LRKAKCLETFYLQAFQFFISQPLTSIPRTPPGVGASIKGGGQENELERTLPRLYYQIVLCTNRKRFEQNDA
jgi:hypothetical protein